MKMAAVAAATLMFAGPLAQEPARPTYLNGEPVDFVIAQPAAKEKAATVGPWKLGARAGESKLHDRRLNLYIVIPGDDFRAESEAQAIYDHNRVISMRPKDDGEAEYDVWWAIALEPRLYKDFRSEDELLAAAQKRFRPGDLFEVKDAPGAGFLREVLKIDTLAELRMHGRRDGTLPQMLIVPAGFAVRGSIVP